MRRSAAWVLLSALLTLGAAAQQAPTSGFFTTSDGVQLHYLEAGSGPGMVFVPGWTMPAWIWEAQLRHFAAHYHVVALDPRSQGESAKPGHGNSPERRAQDVHELVQQLKLGPAVLVGWSLAVPELLTYADPITALVPAQVELFEDAGHALFVDDANRFNALLDDFLSKLPATH